MDRNFDSGPRDCIECGREWILWRHEQEFFERKGLALPRRCKACRDLRRRARDAEASSDYRLTL